MILRRVSGWPGAGWGSPFEELERMRRQMEWLSEGLMGRSPGERIAGVFPLLNITEDKNNTKSKKIFEIFKRIKNTCVSCFYSFNYILY